jgi:plasmid stability protein
MLTIRKLNDDLKAQLRIRAAQHGLSMEEEVWHSIITRSSDRVASRSRNSFANINGYPI